MEIIYLRQAIKDVNNIKDHKLKSKLLGVINSLKLAEDISDIKNIKLMSGYPGAYRIRIGNYRLGLYYSDEKITIARFVKRNDIYKLFP